MSYLEKEIRKYIVKAIHYGIIYDNDKVIKDNKYIPLDKVFKSSILKEYKMFLDKAEEERSLNKDRLDIALINTINWCNENGILIDILESNGIDIVRFMAVKWKRELLIEKERNETLLRIIRNGLNLGHDIDFLVEICNSPVELLKELAEDNNIKY